MAKVDIITVEDIKIGKFSWWSKWIDICVFDYASTGYLLQMKISRTNAKKFRTVGMTGTMGTPYTSILQVGNLTQMKAN